MLKCWTGISSSYVSIFTQTKEKHLNSTKAKSRCLQFIFFDWISIEFTWGPLHIQVITLGSPGLRWRMTDVWEICLAFAEDTLADPSRKNSAVRSSRTGKDTVDSFCLRFRFDSLLRWLIWCSTFHLCVKSRFFKVFSLWTVFAKSLWGLIFWHILEVNCNVIYFNQFCWTAVSHCSHRVLKELGHKLCFAFLALLALLFQGIRGDKTLLSSLISNTGRKAESSGLYGWSCHSF